MWMQRNARPPTGTRGKGVRVQQVRGSESLRRVDPEGSIMLRLSSLHRRQYQVAAPRSLCHMDGNHKLSEQQIGYIIKYIQGSAMVFLF